MPTTITYNSINLNSANIITSDVDDANTPDKDMAIFNLVRSGGAVITDTSYYTKKIVVTGLLKQNTDVLLESAIDTFHSYFIVENKNLDIGYGSGTRRYVCTASRVKVDRPVRGANWANFAIEFIATEYGKDTSTTTLVSASTTTSASATSTLSIGGSAPDQKMRIQITVTAATGLTNKFIAVENDTTGQLLTVTRTWTVSDVLIIDCDAMTVKVNGTNVDFTGAFPTFASGTHDLILTNDFTSRTLTRTYDHTRRYL